MKKLLLTLSFAFTFILANADGEYPYLTFESSDGSIVSIAVMKVSTEGTSSSEVESLSLELQVSDGTLVATNDEGTTVFTLTDLTKMYFSESDNTTEATGIVTVDNSSSSNSVELFTLTGISLGHFSNVESAKSSLTPGVYIIKNKSQQIKISVK